MHELSIVEAFVKELNHAASHDAKRRMIGMVRFRMGSAFSRDALEQGFEVITPGTLLEGARLEIEEVDHPFTCPKCAKSVIVRNEDLHGHMYVCEACGEVSEIDEHGDLQLVHVAWADGQRATPQQLRVAIDHAHAHDHDHGHGAHGHSHGHSHKQ